MSTPDSTTGCDAGEWHFAPGITYLNHGSFGPSPAPVLAARERWLRELESNPMDFYVRRLGNLLDDAAARLAAFLKCPADNLIFVPNATVGMNIVAANVPLSAGDEVLLTDHEYGAVVRIWGRACQQTGAKTILARLPLPLASVDEIVEAIFEKASARTRLLVVSHITSPTAVILPIREICQRAREKGILVCVDGPHAPAMVDVDLNSIPCDFYAASCHKWLCGPFGSGFLYVRSRFKQGLQPSILSWGRSLAGAPPSWKDEFHWPGTFDPTPYLAIPAAIEFLEGCGLEHFRKETHLLAQFARQRLLEIRGCAALTPDDATWYGSMVTVRLPVPDEASFPGDMHSLQKWLWSEHQIEVPVIRWREATHIRVSCHLYNCREQIDHLCAALRDWLSRGT